MALSFEELYRKHFGATKKEISQAKSKNPTPAYRESSGADIRDKYLNDFKGSSKAYSENKSSNYEKSKKGSAVAKSQSNYKDNTKNKYDDGSLWSAPANRDYLNRKSKEELERIEVWSTLSNYQKDYITQYQKETNEQRKINNPDPNRMELSQDYYDDYWKNRANTPLDSVRNQVNYYTEKLNEIGVETPEPKKDSMFDRILRAGISVLQMPDIIGNGIAGFFNEGLNAMEKNSENGVDKIMERQATVVKELRKARRNGNTELVAQLEKEKAELDVQTDEILKNTSKDFNNMLKGGAKSSVATAKSLVTAPFTDKDYNDVVDISQVFNTYRNSEYNERNKLVGDTVLDPIKNSKHEWLNVADDVLINMAGEVFMSKNFEIEGMYDSLKMLRRADDVKTASKITDMTDDNIEGAKQIIRETNRAKVTNEVGVTFKNLTEEERALKVEEILDDMANKKYSSLLKRTNKQLNGVDKDFKGVRIGEMSVVSPELIDSLSKTKFGRMIGNTVGTAFNPIGSVYDAVKSYANTSLLNDNALGKAFVGGKTQDLSKDILRNFEKFKLEGGDATNIYRAVANKADINKLRFVRQFKEDKLKDEIRNLEKQGHKAGINEKNMAEYVEKLEKDNVPIHKGETPYDVKEGIVDSVGTTNKNAMPELKEARDQIRRDLKEFKKVIGEKNFNKFMESLKVDEGKINEIKTLLGDKIDDIIKKREIQGKRYQTRIDNGTGNIENVTKKLQENKELIERLSGRDLEFLPEDVRESVKHILEGKKLENVDFEKEIDELNSKAVVKNKAEYLNEQGKGNEQITNKTIRGLSAKDSKVKNIINNTDDVETLIAYEKTVNNFIEAHHKNLDEIQGSIDEYSKYVEILGNKFNNVNDMLDYYRNSLGDDFKIDKPLYDLQEAVADIVEDIPEKFDAFKGDSKEVIDFTRKLQQSFMDMGIEEGIINEASDYISYVFHMLNPELKDSNVVKQLKRQGFENPFNINSLDRKLKGSIQEINKTIKNEYGIDNWFETNIFKIFANRALNHEKFMYKKELADLLNLNSVKVDMLQNGFDNLQEAEELAKRLGIEWENPVLKDGIGMEKRFVDPKTKKKQYKETQIEYIDPKDGKKKTKKVMKDYDPSTLQVEWKSYTGERTNLIDKFIKNPRETFFSHEVNAIMNNIALDEEGIKSIRKIIDNKTSLSKEEAESVVNILKLSNHEWLPNSKKANVKYSPKEKLDMLNAQIRQKIYDIQNDKDADFVVLKRDKVEEEVFSREVKKEVMDKVTVDPDVINENKVVQEQITNEMLQKLVDEKGMSMDEALNYSSRGEFLVELKARLKEVNKEFTLQGYATNQIDLIKDTVAKSSKNTTLDDLFIIDKNVYNQYQRMIDEANGKKINAIVNVCNKVMNTFKAWALTSTGFHINNIAGGTLNNFMQIGIDSLNPKTAFEVQSMLKDLNKSGFDTSKITGTLYGHSKKDIADAIIENGLLSTFMSVENTNLEDFINTGAKSIVEHKSPFKKLVGAINPLDTQNNILVKGSGAFGNWSEQSMKIQNFFAHIKNGEDIEIASDLAKEAMFDYTDMTTFNEGVKKKLFPFITFVEKNAVFQAEQIAKNPWKGKAMLKPIDQFNDKASEKEKFLTPDYLREAIRVGENKRLNIELPTMSFIQSITQPAELMQQLNPLLKAPYEYITNIQMYNGQEISSLNNPVEKLKYSIETLSPWIRTYQRFGSIAVGNKEESKKTPLEKLISGSETKDKSIEWLKGNKLKTFDTEKAEKQRMYEYKELLEKIYNMSR